MPRYLPIRGEQVMRETLDAYRPEESRSFLMILNAVEAMASVAREVCRTQVFRNGRSQQAAGESCMR